MKTQSARALLLCAAAMVSCGGSGSGGSADAGFRGPTDLVVTWTFDGKSASADACSGHAGTEVYVNLSGTIDVASHKTTTLECEKGSVKFAALRVEKLGMPFVEAALLDKDGITLAMASADVTPQLGTTKVTLDFFTTVTTTASSSSAASSTAASTGSTGGGGTGGTTSGTGGMGGNGGTMGSSTTATTGSTGGTSGTGGADAG